MRESKPASVITTGWSNPCCPAKSFCIVTSVFAFEYVPLVAPHSLLDDRLCDIRPRKNYGHECLAFLEKTVLQRTSSCAASK